MKISFSYILKNKRLVFSALLFFVIIGISLPTFTQAAWWSYIVPSSSIYQITKGLTDTIKGAGYIIAQFTISFYLGTFLTAAFIFSFLSGTLLIWVISVSTNYINYTSLDPVINPVISAGWPIVRDFANMFVVVMLIVIAMATILRIKNYEAGKLLPRLIVAAILINFSLVICGVFIDLSNVIMREFLIGSQVNAAGNWISTAEIGAFLQTLNSAATDAPTIFAAKVMGSIFFYIMKGIISFLFVFLFLFRIMALWILVLLSPLAFASAIAPGTKGMIFDKWLHNFIQWCFIGVFGSLFLYLGNKVNVTMTSQAFPELLVPAGNGSLQVALVQSVTRLATFFVPGAFLVIGLMFSLSLSAMGAGFVTSNFKKYGSGALGAAKSAAKEYSSRTGMLGAARGVADSVTNNPRVNQLRDAIWGRGTTETRTKAVADRRLNPERERLKSIEDIGTLREEMASADRYKSAAAVEKLAKKNALRPADETFVRNAINTGASAGEITKNYADWAHLDTEKMAEFRAKNPHIADERRLERMTRTEAYARMPEDKELMRLPDEEKFDRLIESGGGIDISTGKLHGNFDSRHMQVMENIAEKGKLGKFAKYLESKGVKKDRGINELTHQMNYASKEFGSDVFSEAKKKDPRWAERDEQSVNERAHSMATKAGKTEADDTDRHNAREQINNEAHAKISANQLAKDLDDSIFESYDFISNRGTTARKLAEANKNDNMSDTKREKAKLHIPKLIEDAQDAYDRGDDDLGDELTDRIGEISSWK